MHKKKLIIGITAPGSVGLLPGQMKYFKNLGYDTYLLSPKSERSEKFCEQEGCKLLAVDLKREISLWYDLKALIKIYFIFLKVRPDVINLGTPKVALLGMIAAKISGVKNRIYTCRGLRYEHEKGRLRTILMNMEKLTANCAHTINCISNSVKQLGVNDKIFSENKTVVIKKGSSNGINIAYFSNKNINELDKQALIKKYGLQDSFVFGFLGRLIDRKGISELYSAFDKIYKTNPNVKLLIVGPAENSQISDISILDDIQKHPGIIWPGRTDDVPLHLSIMDVFVLPAWWEGFGNVLVQAAAMGVPVISTTGTGTIDAVSNGYNGILVPIKNIDSLEMAMKEMLINEGLRAQYGKNGIEWAKNFDNTIIWEGLEELYKK